MGRLPEASVGQHVCAVLDLGDDQQWEEKLGGGNAGLL